MCLKNKNKTLKQIQNINILFQTNTPTSFPGCYQILHTSIIKSVKVFFILYFLKQFITPLVQFLTSYCIKRFSQLKIFYKQSIKFILLPDFMLSQSKQKNSFTSIPEKPYLNTVPSKERSRQKNRSKSKGVLRSGNGQSYSASNKNSNIKAYHFSNSIYHGQIRAFQRVGKGLIIHDNGLTGIIRSGSNRLKDHNIFFGQNILISVIYKQHELDFVYKNSNSILLVNMHKKGTEIALNTLGYLIEFDYPRVSKLKFNKDKLVEKLLLTNEETQQIIYQEKFDKIMKQEHIEALKFNLFDPAFSQLNVIPKYRNQVHIGFTSSIPQQYSTTYQVSYKQKDYHNTNLQGLGMIIEKISHDTNKDFRYDFRILERGFYSKGKLEYFGELFYVNGNHYFGGIKYQKMHGNGILVYPNQKRFAFGKFNDGKPVKLDENLSFRLDTQQGMNMYMSYRKRLHSQEPEVWIDGQVHDLPDQQYFLQKLHECTHFVCQDKQIKNYLKQEQELRLSRKVQDFQNQVRHSRSISGRYSNTMSFGQRDGLDKAMTPDLLQNKDLTEQIKRQVEQQGIRQAIGLRLANTQSSPLFFQSINENQFVGQTPIRRINSDKFQPNTHLTNHSRINESIIQGLHLQGNNSSSSNQHSRYLNFQSRIKPTSSEKFNQQSIESKRKQSQHRNQLYLDHAYNINIRSPIESSRASHPSTKRSVSRSGSRQGSRSQSRASSKSPDRQINLFQKFNISPKTFQRSSQINQKYSILDRLYGEANNRAQILQREYEILDQIDKSKYSPHRQSSKKLSSNKAPTNTSKIFDKDYNYSKNRDKSSSVNKNIIEASNQALKLANSNKVKEEKYLQYEHCTHRKRFDYTSQSYDQTPQSYDPRGSARPYSNIGVLSKQTNSQRTPEKISKYDTYDKMHTDRTAKKQIVNSVVSRLYPQHSTQQFNSSKMAQHIYDSKYEQGLPLNKYGITRQDEKKTRLHQDQRGGLFYYGKDFKGSVLRHNAIVKS